MATMKTTTTPRTSTANLIEHYEHKVRSAHEDLRSALRELKNDVDRAIEADSIGFAIRTMTGGGTGMTRTAEKIDAANAEYVAAVRFLETLRVAVETAKSEDGGTDVKNALAVIMNDAALARSLALADPNAYAQAAAALTKAGVEVGEVDATPSDGEDHDDGGIDFSKPKDEPWSATPWNPVADKANTFSRAVVNCVTFVKGGEWTVTIGSDVVGTGYAKDSDAAKAKADELMTRIAKATPIPKRDVEVMTHEYERSHGAAPRGRGSWVFAIGCKTSELDKLLWLPSMLYREARKIAVAQAAALGVYEVEACS